MIPGTPFYSSPFDLGGRKSFQMVLQRSAVPPMLWGFIAVHVQSTDDGEDGKKSWVGMGSPVRLGATDAVWVTFEDARQFVRFLIPEGTEKSGISIEIVQEP